MNLNTLWSIAAALQIGGLWPLARLYRTKPGRELESVIFAAKIREAVARSEFASLFLNSGGAMIGDGEGWIKETCEGAECKKSKFLVSTIDLFG